MRPGWWNLNGAWEWAPDPADRGLRDGWEGGRPLAGRIVVPFPAGSTLSGVPDPEPAPVAWYRRVFDLPAAWRAPRTALRIGACDFETRVFVNGRAVGFHRGGYDPIDCEVAHALRPGRNEVVLRVADPPTWTRPRGKQAAGAARTPVDYDAVHGVWQTVWLEPLPAVSIDGVWTRFDRARGACAVHVALSEPFDGDVEAVLSDGNGEVARGQRATLGRPEARVVLEVPRARLWSPDDPHLHDLRVRLREGGRVVDEVSSYAGLREVAVEGPQLLLNGEPLVVRGVLDQGYFPGGWYAAASDDDLRRDVELTLAMGFNLARKHQKAEDPRWLHHADRLGLLVWAEMPSGRDFTTELAGELLAQWAALVRRDRGHPSIVTWVPMNESWGVWRQAERRDERALVEAMVAVARTFDPTRPVVGNDGWEYAAGDLLTLHLYEGEGEERGGLARRLAALLRDPTSDVLPASQPLGRRRGALPGADARGLPVLVTECGGIGYVPEGREPPPSLFAYGDLPKTADALESRIRRVVDVVRGAPELSGFVWTQLTDVQQEANGLLTFEREPKLPLERLREIFGASSRAR